MTREVTTMRARVLIGEAMDGRGDLCAGGVEDLVEAVEEDEARVGLEPGVEPAPVEMMPHAGTRMEIVEKPETSPEWRSRAYSRNSIRSGSDPSGRRGRLLGPPEEEILKQHRLPRAGIA